MMKTIVSVLMLFGPLVGCSLFTPRGGPEASGMAAPVAVSTHHKDHPEKREVVWHLIEPLGIQLILFHVESKHQEKVLIERTLSEVKLAPGQWQVVGFRWNKKTYRMPKGQERFSFKTKASSRIYAGSFLIQCPKVGEKHLNELKKMSFFNRFNFTSTSGSCQMVVGDQFTEVNRAWQALENQDKEPLIIGF